MRLERSAVVATASSIECLLQDAIFPAKDIITVLSVAGWVTGAQDERLRAIFGPLSLVVEFAGVPDDLVVGVSMIVCVLGEGNSLIW